MFTKVLTASNLVRATSSDLSSQINHVWTVMILLSMGLLISLVQYVGDPIQCWCPAHMAEVHCNYTKALCWVKETYHIDFGDPLPMEHENRKINEVTYYPWAPWVLFFMAAMFKFPHILWTGLSPLSNLDIENLIESADADESISELATLLRIWLFQSKMKRRKDRFYCIKRQLGSLGMFWLGRHRRTYLTGLVIFIKMLYLAVSTLMFMSLNIFIDENFTTYGFDMVVDFLNGVVHDSARFPKNTVCDFKLRQMNNVNTYSIECILPINLYNQKIFLFLWFWYLVLTMSNLFSMLNWAFNLLSPERRWKFVNDYVIIRDHIRKHQKLLETLDDTVGNASVSGSGSATESGTGTLTVTGLQPSSGDSGDILNLEAELENEEDIVMNSDEDASLLSVGLNTDGTRLRVGRHVNFIQDGSIFHGRKIKKKKRRYLQMSPIETNQDEIRERMERREIWRQTVWIYNQFDYDGVVVFRKLESAVGVVLSNDIFCELFNQLKEAEHHSKT